MLRILKRCHLLIENDGRTAIFLNTKGTRNDVSKDLQNFLHYVDNKDVNNDPYVDELQEYISLLNQSTKWRKGYMDNKTHMMFHDEDVREEGIKIGEQRGLKLGLEKGQRKGQESAIRQMIALTRQLGVSEDQLKQKVQKQFDLSDEALTKFFE
ncbi:hypothetical protein HMPREF0501_00899 [Limosilactobacillus coleohominis 101-4-CHN]|uniref:Rpn family recombination-promoting nuclease/putative transposase n=1 Tax=Limosilactobacillus coleohominis 101-4-CHN TaxID=575594 RepID=C7XW05_9LACO|nr:hypothetical protein [Limosilactobacillus coleohominis]EEU30521.1 hypothetical protein HMPREF0501_00899 [Limosilactobacillus coleohominis 101-4-CHN]